MVGRKQVKPKKKVILFPNDIFRNAINKIFLGIFVLAILLIICGTILAGFILSGLSKQDESSGKIDCSLEDIYLKNITYHTMDMQWINSTEYRNKLINESIDNLPIPRVIHCSGEFTIKSNKLFIDNLGNHLDNLRRYHQW